MELEKAARAGEKQRGSTKITVPEDHLEG